MFLFYVCLVFLQLPVQWWWDLESLSGVQKSVDCMLFLWYFKSEVIYLAQFVAVLTEPQNLCFSSKFPLAIIRGNLGEGSETL